MFMRVPQLQGGILHPGPVERDVEAAALAPSQSTPHSSRRLTYVKTLATRWKEKIGLFFLFVLAIVGLVGNLLTPRLLVENRFLRHRILLAGHPVIGACTQIREAVPFFIGEDGVIPLTLERSWTLRFRESIVLEKLANLSHLIPSEVYCICLGDLGVGIDKRMRRASSVHGLKMLLEWPVLALSAPRTEVESGRVVLIPDFEAMEGHKRLFDQVDHAKAPAFRERLSRIHWRGSTTGLHYATVEDFRRSTRVRFMDYVNEHEEVRRVSDVGFTAYVQFATPELKATFASRYPLVPGKSVSEAVKNKYLLDLDGNANAYSRLAWSLYSGSLVLKVRSEFMQWFYPKLKDGVNYLSINEDFSNLKERFDWAEANPDLAETITRNARELVKEVFSSEAIDAAIVEAFRKAADSSRMLRINEGRHPG